MIKYLSFAHNSDSFRLSVQLQLLVLLYSVQEVSSALGMVHVLDSDVDPIQNIMRMIINCTLSRKKPVEQIMEHGKLKSILNQ